MITADSVKFSSVSCKIFPCNTGEPSRSTFDAQSLLFGVRSRHDCGNTKISFVLLSFRTIWAAKHRTKVHHSAKASTSTTFKLVLAHAICFDACPTFFYIYHYTSTPSLRGLCARVGQRSYSDPTLLNRAATTPGTSCPTLFDKCVGSLTSHRILELKELWDGTSGL